MHRPAVYRPAVAYRVHRRDPELVVPAAQTPRETKRLSDLDDTDNLRVQVPTALFYRGDGGGDAGRPVGAIRRALGEALVHYYPLAGRLREIEGRKLVVDCTGEGVLFVQADADVRLADLELRPPFPCWDQLLFDVEGSSGVLNCPLLLIQVTRLLCGGFVFALRFNHTMCDGIGIAQFMHAVGDRARGLPSMAVTPVWSRELLEARIPPTPSLPPRSDQPPPPAMVTRCFTFGASDVAAIKKSLRFTATTFESLAAFVWRARTAALELPPGEAAPLAIAANFRGAAGMGLPAGYYGNASPPAMVCADAAALRDGSLGDAVAQVRLAKATVTARYFRSMLDALVGRRWFSPANSFCVSDTRVLLTQVDFGWGRPVFAGPADAFFGVSFFITVKDDGNGDGEDAVGVPMVLPQPAMDRFTAEVERLLVDLKPNHTSLIMRARI